MWPVRGRQENPGWLRPDPVRVLYEFDGPRIFLCRDVPGGLYLAYQCGEDRQAMRFLVVPCDLDLEWRLTAGEINVRDALTRGKAWLLDFNNDWSPARCWTVDVDELPPGVLPEPGVMLYAHLRPVMARVTVRPRAAEEPPVTLTWAPSQPAFSLAGVG